MVDIGGCGTRLGITTKSGTTSRIGRPEMMWRRHISNGGMRRIDKIVNRGYNVTEFCSPALERKAVSGAREQDLIYKPVNL
jgi:hypothetical protein